MMHNLYRQINTPLLSLFLFTLGNGFLSTLTILRSHHENISTSIIGLMTAFFYLGLVLGSFKIERMIRRIGHIRTFSAFASILTITALMQAVYFDVYLWLVLRLITGFATAVLYVVIESWLLVISRSDNRGKIVAIYMVVLYLGQALSQSLVATVEVSSIMPFILIGITSSLSVIPLAMTNIASPRLEEPTTLNLVKMIKATTSGVLACFTSGLVLGPIYGLLPLYLIDRTKEQDSVGLFMFLVIFGGMLLQYPVGKISDYLERRLVLLSLSILAGVSSLCIMLSVNYYWLLGFLVFIFGGLTFTLYPVSISHSCDSLEHKDITSGTQALLLFYSIGAVIGPLLAPLFMKVFGSDGLFIYFIMLFSVLTILLCWRKTIKANVPQEEHFFPIPTTTPVMSEIDPRAENIN
ncbi:MAG: MFS transporter [Gammaproteobacteria bacterium]|nr:MFS transporter [Gammaproteobacteria bacterium]